MSLAEPFPRLVRPIVSPDLEARRPEAKALLDAMGDAGSYPGGERTILIARTVAALVEGGVWDRLDCLYVLAAHSAAAARLNWKDPASFTLTPQSSPTFTVDRGYTGDGVGAYLATGYNPTLVGSMALNDHHLAAWANDGEGEATSSLVGTRSFRIRPRLAGNVLGTRSGIGTEATSANSQALAHLGFSRSNSADYQTYKNGAALEVEVQASSAIQSDQMLLLCYDNNGVPTTLSARRLLTAHWGASVTEAQMLATYNALASYKTAVGA